MSESGSIREYARKQVNRRLDRLADLVRAAESAQDPDSIHDLRVGIRRFTQGLRLFPDLLPAEPVKRIRKTLKRMMNLTSEVRNRDIALKELDEKGSDKLTRQITDLRKRYADEFSALVREWNASGFAEQWRGELLLKPVPKSAGSRAGGDGRREETATQRATDCLPKLAGKYFLSGRDVAALSSEPAEFHRFRVKTKQFRYALEIFQPVYHKALDPHLDELKEIQDQLGKVSDIYTTHGLLKGEDEIRKKLKKKGKDATQSFQTYWTSTFDAPGQRRAWKQMLRSVPPAKPVTGSPAPAPRKRSKAPAKAASKPAPKQV